MLKNIFKKYNIINLINNIADGNAVEMASLNFATYIFKLLNNFNGFWGEF